MVWLFGVQLPQNLGGEVVRVKTVKLRKLSAAQKESILNFVLDRRGYIVQAFSKPIEIGVVLRQLNISPSLRYRKQPFRVISETTSADFWEQNRLGAELGDYGIEAVNPENFPHYAKFYRLATD